MRTRVITDDYVVIRYNEDEPRDDHGRWGDSGGGDSGSALSGQDALKSSALRVEPTSGQTDALVRYGVDGAYVINADLRTNGGDPQSLTDKNRTSVEQLDSLMHDSPLPNDVVVYRNVATQKVFGEAESADMTGLTFTDHGFVSTSTSPRVPNYQAVTMRILAPAGTPGFSEPSALDRDEVLLGRGLTFRVVADNGKGDQFQRQLDVEVVTK